MSAHSPEERLGEKPRCFQKSRRKDLGIRRIKRKLCIQWGKKKYKKIIKRLIAA